MNDFSLNPRTGPMLDAEVLTRRLRDVLPANHSVRTLPPGSIEIAVGLRGDPSFSCSVVYPASAMQTLLRGGLEALRDKLHERCVSCEKRQVCRAA